MKRLLIISYHFPPDSEIGAIRPGKFAQYLPNFGWEPFVLTVTEEHYSGCDYAKMGSSLDSVKTYRTRPVPSPLQAWSKLTGAHDGAGKAVSSGNGAVSEGIPHRPSSLKRFASSLLRLPDDRQGWAATVLKEGYRIMKREAIDIFLTSGPPMSTHLGGLALKRLTGVYWIADFRDPWVVSRRWSDPAFRSAPCDLIEERLERSVLKAADLVVSTAPRLTRYFRSRLPLDRSRKCVTVTNGYDERDFAGLQPSTVPGKGTGFAPLVLRHAGSLYLGRTPEPFFRTLRSLIDKDLMKPDAVRVEFIGNGYYNNTPLTALSGKYGLESIVSVVPAMPYKACLQTLSAADGLLLFAQGFPEQIPAKVFECLRLNRPVFAVVDKGDAMDMMKGFARCFIADPQRGDLMEEHFLRMLSAMARGHLCLNQTTGFEQYERRNLTAALVSQIEGRANAVTGREGGLR